ncbi:right-handed parallel beta-helix repeat-containing protein, partial [Candidatus Woesearchaeota archaeon]|nr:right-handed parallel beta-helix repeat-containing protein [Candidatus Woesearchaeota archaeon]
MENYANMTENLTVYNMTINYTGEAIRAYYLSRSNFTDIRVNHTLEWAMDIQDVIGNNTFRDMEFSFTGQSFAGGAMDYGGSDSNNLFDNIRCYHTTDSCISLYGYQEVGPNNITNVYVYNVSDDQIGVYIWEDGNYLSNITTERVSGYGLWLQGTDITAEDVHIIGNLSDYEGLYVVNSLRTSVLDSEVYNRSDAGIYVSNSDDCTFHNVTVHDTVTAINFTATSQGNNVSSSTLYDNIVAIGFSNGDNNLAYNNTISGNDYGVYIDPASTGNTFYYNNFTSNTIHAKSTITGNYFNRTNTGKAAGFQAEGNWWDDVPDMNIYDTDDDGYGDFGSEYPYNSSYSSKVTANVSDWGPVTDKNCADDDNDGYGAEGSYRDLCTYPDYPDCNDNNASFYPPRDDLNITENTWLCSGTYFINDAANNGLVNFKADDISLACNKTLVVGSNSGYAFAAVGRDNVTLAYCNASNYSRGIYLDSTTASTVRNNSIFNTTYGAYLSASTGNLFYYNSFRNSSSLHATSDLGGNHFNTSMAGFGRGNYWGGVESLKIYDTQSDGFGDAGLAYPYSSGNGGLVNSNVTDWGPITTRVDFRIQPPILFQPADLDIITDSRNPLYGWTNPEHTLSDSVTYQIQVDDNSDFGSPVLQQAGIPETLISTYYWNSSWLDFSTTYYWHVRANDTYNLSEWSASRSFSILPTTSCTQPSDEMDFGSMCVLVNQTICDQNGWGSHINDTLDNHPPPYGFENDGNLQAKGKVYSTNLWESNTKSEMPSIYYQYMMGVNESGAYDWALDSSWVNMTNTTGSALLAFYGFKWQNVSDANNLHIRLESPTDEPPGIKYSTTYIECEQNETYY